MALFSGSRGAKVGLPVEDVRGLATQLREQLLIEAIILSRVQFLRISPI